MNLLDGMYPYELVLLTLGAVLFLMLAALLAMLVVRGKTFAGLLVFFAIPIAMIGYPSIQKLTFQDGVLTIENMTEHLQVDPTDATLRSSLERQVASVASRPIADPDALAKIARAQFALGKHSAAETTMQKARRMAPALPQVVALEQRIQIDRALTTLTSELAQHPNDEAARLKLANTVAQAASLKVASPVWLAHVASAQAALGDKAQARSFAGKALKINPNLTEARQLKRMVESPTAHS